MYVQSAIVGKEAQRLECTHEETDCYPSSGRVSARLHTYEARTLLNESANRVGEYPCRIMCSTNPLRREKFSGVMPCIFHLDML